MVNRKGAGLTRLATSPRQCVDKEAPDSVWTRKPQTVCGQGSPRQCVDKEATGYKQTGTEVGGLFEERFRGIWEESREERRARNRGEWSGGGDGSET